MSNNLVDSMTQEKWTNICNDKHEIIAHLEMKNGWFHRSCVVLKLVVELAFLYRCAFLNQYNRIKIMQFLFREEHNQLIWMCNYAIPSPRFFRN